MAGINIAPGAFGPDKDMLMQGLYLGLLNAGANALQPSSRKRGFGEVLASGLQDVVGSMSGTAAAARAQQDKDLDYLLKVANQQIMERHYNDLNKYYESTSKKQAAEADEIKDKRKRQSELDEIAASERGHRDTAAAILRGGSWIEDVGEGTFVPDDEMLNQHTPDERKGMALAELLLAGKDTDDSVVRAITQKDKTEDGLPAGFRAWKEDPKGYLSFRRAEADATRDPLAHTPTPKAPRTEAEIKKDIRTWKGKLKDEEFMNKLLAKQYPDLAPSLSQNEAIKENIKELEEELLAVTTGKKASSAGKSSVIDYDEKGRKITR